MCEVICMKYESAFKVSSTLSFAFLSVFLTENWQNLHNLPIIIFSIFLEQENISYVKANVLVSLQ